MSNLGNKQIICSYFQSISSPTSGAILNVNNVDIKITNSRFFKINSNIYPGCFLVKNSKFTLSLCYFDYCYTKGRDMSLGKISYFQYSTVKFDQFSCIRCGPTKTAIGDSINVFEYSKSNINSYNTSYCYGIDGSSSISIYSPSDSTVKNMNCVDCIDWCSYETFYNEEIVEVIDSNIINSTKNSDYCVNFNSGNKNHIFTRCAFFKICSSFCSSSSALSLVDCISDVNKNGYSFITITKISSFKLILKVPHNCGNTQGINIKSKPKLAYFLLVILTTSH